MTKKKTRAEKINQKTKESTEKAILYTLDSQDLLVKEPAKKPPTESTEVRRELAHVKKILIASVFIFAIHIIVFSLFATNTVHLGFLGY